MRSESGDASIEVGTSNATSFGDTDLNPDTDYSYTVIVENGVGLRAGSGAAAVHTPAGTVDSGGGDDGGGDGSGGGDESGGSDGGSDTSGIPILEGTTSVGGGSDDGSDTTDGSGSSGSGSSGASTAGAKAPTVKIGPLANVPRTLVLGVAGGGSLIVILLLVAGYFVLRGKHWNNIADVHIGGLKPDEPSLPELVDELAPTVSEQDSSIPLGLGVTYHPDANSNTAAEVSNDSSATASKPESSDDEPQGIKFD
jgi:hypothetical protein